METSSSERSRPERLMVRLGALIMAGLAFIAALAKALEGLPKFLIETCYLWIGHFLWDCVIVCLVFGMIPWIGSIYGIKFWASVWRIVRFGKAWEVALIVTTLQLNAVLMVPVWAQLKSFYGARYDSAHMDWHFVYAKDAMQAQQYDRACSELKLVGTSLYYHGFTNNEQDQIPTMLAECKKRSTDAKELLARFANCLKAGGLTFEDVLLTQRAAVLDPSIRLKGSCNFCPTPRHQCSR